ncbi:MAG: DUF4214 domain-containing protein, partial [Gemmiger sp.]|nr:DUF4214 domain-containing protein [Gemmiger sp.]
TNVLLNGSQPGAQVASGFVFSAEMQNRNYCNEHFVTALYNALFDRGPDAGIYGWVAQLDSGATRGQIYNGFIGSQEFITMCNNYGIPAGTGDWSKTRFVLTGNCSIDGKVNKTVYDFVDRLYKTCLDRTPDPAGRADWVAQLRDGRNTGAGVALGFIFSDEFKRHNYNNGDYVEHLYLAFLGRPSDPAGKADWVGRLNGGQTRESIFQGFVGSNEFSGLCAQYGIIRG